MSITKLPQTLFTGDFQQAFARLIGPSRCEQIFASKGPRRGGTPTLSAWQWLMARVYHVMAMTGTFAAHVKQITQISISDSALSQRGQSIGWKLLAEVLGEVLCPLADAVVHSSAFYHGLRLLALDGTRFNMRNTKAINSQAVKTRCSKGNGQPAFANLLAVVLVELGLHQPLDAALGWCKEGEVTLARQLCNAKSIPAGSLLLGDRLFGSPWLLWDLLPVLQACGSACLLRVKSNIKVVRERRLADGSWLVNVPVVDPATRRKVGTIQVREILADIRIGKDGEVLKIRLWTTLLDAEAHPAMELVELYASRWEQELFFRELKSHLHGRDSLLNSGTPDTAAQEVLAMILAASIIASQREAVAAAAEVEVLRVSFAMVHQATVALCQVFEIGHDLINPEQRAKWTLRVVAQLAETAIIQKRKPRSCKRALRQPVKDWPKMKIPTSIPLIKHITISNP
jgi:hypothetical protein